MEFFNFWNAETFHVFQWVTNCKAVDVDAMIAAAFEAVKPEDLGVGTLRELALGKIECALDNLSQDLQELVEAQFGQLAGMCGGFEDIDCWGIAEVPDGSANSLLLPILARAMDSIDYKVVARALLIRAGKWTPDLQIPDAL
jgi:hypothetical protein